MLILTPAATYNPTSYINQNLTRAFSIPIQFCLRFIFQSKHQKHNVVCLFQYSSASFTLISKMHKSALRCHLTYKICAICVAQYCPKMCSSRYVRKVTRMITEQTGIGWYHFLPVKNFWHESSTRQWKCCHPRSITCVQIPIFINVHIFRTEHMTGVLNFCSSKQYNLCKRLDRCVPSLKNFKICNKINVAYTNSNSAH
jgi:hypothetical protein